MKTRRNIALSTLTATILFLVSFSSANAACPSKDISANFTASAISLVEGLIDSNYYSKYEFENGILFKSCRAADVTKCDAEKTFIISQIRSIDSQVKSFKDANPGCDYAYSKDTYAIDLCTWGINRNRLCALGVQLVPLEPIELRPNPNLPDPSCRVGGSIGINTGLGCIPTQPSDFVTFFLRFGMGLGGLLALLFIIYGGFTIATSSGQPEKLKSGQEYIVSAITGLILIIFAVVLLGFIGYDILRIPGFTP